MTSSGRLSPRPATSRSGVNAANIPCSIASSPRPRDLVSMIRSALRVSWVKTQAWPIVQETTVNAIAIETSRLAASTRGELPGGSGPRDQRDRTTA